MQVPYILKQLGLQPKRTIRVIAYANEENGLRGAKAYAETQAKPSGVTTHGTRAGVIQAADQPMVAGRVARKGVIER